MSSNGSATRKLYIRFVRDPGMISSFICYYTWGEWSHVEFVFESGYLGARLSGGVRVRPYDYVTPVKQEFRYLTLSAEDYNNAVSFLYSQVGKPYDWQAILGLGIRNDFFTYGKSWFCSELVQAGSQAAKTPLLNTEHVDRITPRDVGLSTVAITDSNFNPLTYNWSKNP